MRYFLAIGLIGLINFTAIAPPALAQARVAAQVLADKSAQVIIFYDRESHEIARFSAVFGRAPDGPKQVEGDLRTPEGDYWLKPARASKTWEWFMPISYPNYADIARARREGRPLNKLGGDIGIHPVKGFMRKVKQVVGENWTFGCIAVSESAMEEIRALITQPTPIRIQP